MRHEALELAHGIISDLRKDLAQQYISTGLLDDILEDIETADRVLEIEA